MNSLVPNDKGQAGTRAAIGLVITISVAVLVGAVLLPVAIDNIEGNTTTAINQTDGETYDVNGELTSTLTDSSDTDSDVTVELNDTRTAGTTSNTISVGDTADYNLDGGTVTVGVESESTGYATANYTYDKDYAYSDGARSIWGLLGLAVVLVLLLFLVSKARMYAP